jgi:prevent-host-death family protein
MATSDPTIAAARFKAQCLALLDQVERTGRSIVITKRGKPMARLVNLSGSKPKSLRGSVLAEHDLVSPLGEEWEAAR